jgi:hypothetical protein
MRSERFAGGPLITKNEVSEVIRSLEFGPVYSVDATELNIVKQNHQLQPLLDIIFFNCPWTYEIRAGYTIGQLIRRFLESAGSVQEAGNLVMLGLVMDDRWCVKYQFEELKRSCPSLELPYDYVGKDLEVVEILLAFGYIHMGVGVKSIHDLVMPSLEIHVFKRR